MAARFRRWSAENDDAAASRKVAGFCNAREFQAQQAVLSKTHDQDRYGAGQKKSSDRRGADDRE
jgi:hypothetical protein